MLEGLPDREVEAHAPRLRLAVHQETWNRIQLVPEIDANGTNRRVVAKTRTDVVAKVVEIEIPRLRPDVPRVDECDGRETPPYRHAQFAGRFELRVPAARIAFSVSGLTSNRPHPRRLEAPPRK